MNFIQTTSFVCVCLVALAQAAPTETPAGQASSETTVATAQAQSTAATLTGSAPATDDSANKDNTTASMAVSQAHDQALNTSSFTCYGRSIGYYADAEQECKVYHFCLLGEYNGEPVYQRISYLCLNQTVFDQQALDCVETVKLTAPCKESSNFYDSSNSILRTAIVGNQMHQGGEAEKPKSEATSPTAASTTTTPAPTTPVTA